MRSSDGARRVGVDEGGTYLASGPSVSTVPPVFEPPEKRKISSSSSKRGTLREKTRSGLKPILVGSEETGGVISFLFVLGAKGRMQPVVMAPM